MDVDPSQSLTYQSVAFEERQCLRVGSLGRLRQGLEQPEELGAMLQVPTRQLSDDQRMGPDAQLLERGGETCVAAAKVIHPNGGVDEH